MVGISRLYCGTVEASDPLRYARRSAPLPTDQPQSSANKRPVVVWNCTRRCNLNCVHCYSDSTDRLAVDELTGAEARAMIDDLARFCVPVLLFSGGEPLMRPDVLELVAYARSAGLRTALSTNGTLITESLAAKLAQAGLSYVGVSLDGPEAVNDKFRGSNGAFARALEGIRNCQAAGLKVGLRFTLNQHNRREVPAIFDLVLRENIPRVCFYHLVRAGRGRRLAEATLTHAQTRGVLDLIMDRTAAAHAGGRRIQVLTVDNHADGPYVYLRLHREGANPQRAENCLQLLRINGGNASGSGIGCIGWNGEVLPDQFWRHHVLGNVRRRRFSEIWADDSLPLLAKLRNRKQYLKCRCRQCRWLDVCNGNFRARAEAAGGAENIWGDDPGCYLTDQEITPEQ